MATVTAESELSRSGTDPTRHLWQLPVFLLGIGAFFAVYKGLLPVVPPDPANAFRVELGLMRAASEKPIPDPGELRAMLAKVASSAEAYPEAAQLTHFLLGSGYVRLAELTPEPTEARSFWGLAKQHFDAVRPDQFDDPNDAPRFAFRSAKARAVELPASATPGEIAQVRDRLKATPFGENPGEAPRLFAELSLRVIPPDLKNARDSLASYISDAGLATPAASLSRAKLRLSEIHLRLGEQENAKKWLSRIGSDAQRDVLSTAKAQLARIKMADHDWSGASKDWQQVRAISDLAPALRAASAYNLGICLTQAKPADLPTAAKMFEEASKSEGSEAYAAAIKLAEMRLKAPEPARHLEAVRYLALGVKIFSGSETNQPGLLSAAEVQQVHELAINTLLADEAFDAAVKVTDSYKCVAVAGRDREKRAEILAAWAEATAKSGGDANPKLTAAAQEYIAIVELRPSDTDKAEQYRRAAALYRKAGIGQAAIAAIEKIIKLPKLPDEVIGPIWIEYAEDLLRLNRPEEALAAFRTAMATSGPTSSIARFRLAKLLLDGREPMRRKLALALLEQMTQMERVAQGEQEVHERAFVELANEYMEDKNFAEAEGRLRTDLKLYPTGNDADLARLLLGICLIQRADPKANPAVPDPPKTLEEAMTLLQEVVAEVESRRKNNKPGENDKWLRVQARLRILQIHQKMDRQYDLLDSADSLRNECRNTIEELLVMSLMYEAYKRLDKPEIQGKLRDEMRVVFEKLKEIPNAFPAKSGDYSRDYWETIWFKPMPMK